VSGVCIDVVIERATLGVSGSDVTFTISADDPRTIRAIEIAAEADQWLSGHDRQGEEVYGVPSQSEPGRYYIVTRRGCDCPDFAQGTVSPAKQEHACKHMLAVRLHTELVRAQRRPSRPAGQTAGRHLRVVRREEPDADDRQP
jgi:hypothetical protein